MARELPLTTSVLSFAGTGGARIADETLLRFLVELEVAKAQRLHYGISLVCLALDSLAGAGDGDMDRFVERLVDRLRSTDVVVPHPPWSWTLLLVDARPESLPSIVHRITEPLGSLPWRAGVASYPGDASGAEDLLELRKAFPEV